MTWKLINDLDEESLRRLLDELPAWVKVCVCAGAPLHMCPADLAHTHCTMNSG